MHFQEGHGARQREPCKHDTFHEFYGMLESVKCYGKGGKRQGSDEDVEWGEEG